MAAVNYTRGVKLVLKIGNGATPEVFTPWCSINAERGITFTSALNDEVIPDCADPDKIAWVAREKQSRSMAFTGGGMLDKSDVAKAWEIDESEDSFSFQVVLDDDLPANVITWEGNAIRNAPDDAAAGDHGLRGLCRLYPDRDPRCRMLNPAPGRVG